MCSWVTQFMVLLRRAMLGQLRNPTDTTSRLFLSTWVGVLAGTPIHLSSCCLSGFKVYALPTKVLACRIA